MGEINKKKVIKLPTPLDYQRDVIDYTVEDGVKFVTFLKSRQSGGSFLNKLFVLKWGLSGKDEKIGYITPTLKLSKLFFKELCESVEPYIKIANKSDLYIEFVTGSNLQFFSAESDEAIRGFQFTRLIVDEAAFMKSDFFDTVLRATVLIKGKTVLLCSTPYLSEGFFHQHYQFGMEDNMTQYRSKKITICDNPFVDKNEIEIIKKSIPEKIFRQEYLAEFLDGDGIVFSNYKNCVGVGRLTGNYYAAIDWGKMNDYTALTIMNEFKEVVYLNYWTELDYTVQVQIIVKILNEWKPINVVSEENNIGTVVNELLTKEYNGEVECVTLDNKFKREMIENLIVAFETKDIKIMDNKKLLDELGYFSVQYNPQTQTVKYAAKTGLHDDAVISLAYCYYATNYKQTFSVIR